MSTRALGEFLRERRERLTPADVGLAPGVRSRRTPGLRRDEVAAQSRMSLDYYTQLEQARGARPSSEMLEAIAQALRLDRAERDHLHHLAGLSPRPERIAPSVAPASLLDLLDRLTETAVMVVDAKQEMVAWNALASLLFEEDFTHTPDADRNFARRYFLNPNPRKQHFGLTQSKPYAVYIAAELRRAQARYPHDVGIAKLIADLRSGSAAFESLWRTGEVSEPVHVRKSIVHSTEGRIYIRCDALVVPEHDLRVVLFTAKPRTRSARAIRRLAASVPTTVRGPSVHWAAE